MLAVGFRGLDALSKKAKTPVVDLPIESMSLSLQDLIGYLHPPDEHLEHEDKQNRLRALKNRQNLFQEEVGPVILLSCSWANNFLVGKDPISFMCCVEGEVRRSRCTGQDNRPGGSLAISLQSLSSPGKDLGCAPSPHLAICTYCMLGTQIQNLPTSRKLVSRF